MSSAKRAGRIKLLIDSILRPVLSAMVGGRDQPAACIDCGTVIGVFVTSHKIGDYLVLCAGCSAKREGRAQDGAADIDPPDTIRVYVGTGVGSTTARAEIKRQTDAAYAELLTELDAQTKAADPITCGVCGGTGTDDDPIVVANLTGETAHRSHVPALREAAKQDLERVVTEARAAGIIGTPAEQAEARQWLGELAGDDPQFSAAKIRADENDGEDQGDEPEAERTPFLGGSLLGPVLPTMQPERTPFLGGSLLGPVLPVMQHTDQASAPAEPDRFVVFAGPGVPGRPGMSAWAESWTEDGHAVLPTPYITVADAVRGLREANPGAVVEQVVPDREAPVLALAAAGGHFAFDGDPDCPECARLSQGKAGRE